MRKQPPLTGFTEPEIEQIAEWLRLESGQKLNSKQLSLRRSEEAFRVRFFGAAFNLRGS